MNIPHTAFRHAVCAPYLAWVLLATLPLAAWAESKPAAQHNAAAKAQRPSSSAEAAELPVATFTGGRISVAEVVHVIEQKPQPLRAAAASDKGKQQLLRELIDYDLLALEAERRGYDKQAAVEQARKRVAVDALVADEARAASVDPAAPEVSAYFTAHAADFQRPALRRASQIQVASEASARQLISELQGQSREHFAAVARERSEDLRTRRQGGELGYCDEQGQAWQRPADQACPPAVAKAVFALSKIGEVGAEPVAHDGMFSVVMFTGQMPAKQPALERVRGKIALLLSETAQTKRVDELVARLRAEHPVEEHPELVDHLELPPAQARDVPAGFSAAPPDPWAPPRIVPPDQF